MAAPTRTTSILWALFALDGRVNREVFWLGNFGVGFIALIFMMPSINPDTGAMQLSPLSPFAFVGLFWTEVALAVKRLHDRGLTGWLAAAFLIPFVGFLAFFVIGFLPGDKGPNAYAPATNMRGPV